MTKPTLYKRAILAFFLIGTAIFLPIILIYALSLGLHFLPEWLLVAIFGCISPLVSGMGYKGKLLDKTATIIESNEFELGDLSVKTPEDPTKTAGETAGLVIGITAAITVSILALVLHEALPFGGALGEVFGTFMMFVANAGLFMGLCSRSGRVADYFRHASQKENPLQQERVNYVLAITVGILIGSVIVAATLATGGTMGVLAAIGCVSSCASASGYIGICFDVLLGKRTLLDAICNDKNHDQTTLWDRLKSPEAMGTLIGVGIGIVIAISIISAGVTLPIIGGGLLAGIVFVSAGGGLGNRLGHLLTKVQNLKAQFSVDNDEYQADDESDSGIEVDHEYVPKPAPQLQEEEKWQWKKDYKNSTFKGNYCNIGQFRDLPMNTAARESANHEQAFSFNYRR